MIKDRLENFYHSSNEVKETLNLKILSDIPFLKSKRIQKSSSLDDFLKKGEKQINKKNILKENQIKRNLYFHKEAFKFLVSSLILEKEKEDFKILNFTSAIQGEENKQFLSLQKHCSMKKGTLIDGDLKDLDCTDYLKLIIISEYLI